MRRFQSLYSVVLLALLSSLTLVGCRDALFDRSFPDCSEQQEAEVTPGTPGGEVTEYKVPLYTIVDNRKLFEIRRNTIYRIYATLNGDQLIVNGNYVVDPWINRDVDSPW